MDLEIPLALPLEVSFGKHWTMSELNYLNNKMLVTENKLTISFKILALLKPYAFTLLLLLFDFSS
jgi:hypothetical protein